MKVYIQAQTQGMPYNVNTFSAMLGFQQMGFETALFQTKDELSDISIDDMVVGGVGRVKYFLEQHGIFVEDIDYPEQLKNYYGRSIWKSTVNELLVENNTNIFVKPTLGKQFSGFVYKTSKDLIGRISPNTNVEIYCSQVLNIKTEWRCFVRYGKILDIRKYRGDLGVIYNLNTIYDMIHDYKDAPAGYALDIGVTDKNETVIIEINDGYSLGCYGLDPLLYAKLLSARWSELTHATDECDF